MVAVLAAALLAVALAIAGQLFLRLRRLRRKSRSDLYETLYGLDWGSVTTNNYGFAPSSAAGPERYQLQMYTELVGLLRARGLLAPHIDLLEVSCGRGGGLAHLVRQWPGPVRAVGLDLSFNALRFCAQAHGDVADLAFVRGTALALPFRSHSFDVVVNVEAAGDYGDYGAFFREVSRVLRPGGAFLYSDPGYPAKIAAVTRHLLDAGLHGEFRDITGNVVDACRLDDGRRRQMIRARVPWHLRPLIARRLHEYAAVVGTRKFEAFRSRQRLYLMTCAVKTDTDPVPAEPATIAETAG